MSKFIFPVLFHNLEYQFLQWVIFVIKFDVHVHFGYITFFSAARVSYSLRHDSFVSWHTWLLRADVHQRSLVVKLISRNRWIETTLSQVFYFCHFLDVIILMTEINHAYLRIMLPKEWFLNIYFILDMVTDKGKCLVWSLHGWFGIIVLKCSLISSAFGLRRWTLAPKGFFNSSQCCDRWHMEAGWGSPHVRSGKQICKGHSCTLTPLMHCTAHM